MTHHNRGIIDALRQQPTADLHSFLINQGKGFTTSYRVNDLGNGTSIYLYLNNPTEDIDYDVVLLPRSTGRADLDISFGATENTQGTERDVNNLKSGSSRTFSGTIRSTQTDSDYDHGTMFIEDFVPGDGTGALIAGQVVESIAFTVDAGDNKLLELRNESGGTVSRIGLNVVVFEVTGEFKEIDE